MGKQWTVTILSCHFGGENENEPWDFGVPSFQTHPSATLFLQWKNISGGNIVVGAGNICEVPPRNPRNCRGFTTPGTGCLLQGLHQGLDQVAGERCAGAQGCPVSRPLSSSVGGGLERRTSLGSEEKQGSDKLGYQFPARPFKGV